MPKISVIMGAYNCASTIKACVKSIQKQTISDWEFIICDDCSADNTYEVLKSIAESDRRIILIRNKQNLRLAATLNNCLRRAQGEYIARMDADDVSLPDRFEKQINFLEVNKDYAVVGTAMYIIDENGKRYESKGIEIPTPQRLIYGTPFAHPTIMMRKAVMDDLKGYRADKKTMRAEDLDLWFRFYSKGYKGYNLQTPLYQYTLTLQDYRKRSLQAAIQTAKIYLDGYRLLKFPPYVYVFALKPITSAILPDAFMKKWHENKGKRC